MLEELIGIMPHPTEYGNMASIEQRIVSFETELAR
jgi:hypothetical protein